MAYTSNGAVLASTGPTPNPLQYAGQYLDSESGLYFLRARYFDPVSGQFLSLDPLVALTGSPYGYVGENPLNGIDPYGLSYTCWRDAGGDWKCANDPVEQVLNALSLASAADCLSTDPAVASAKGFGCGKALGLVALTIKIPSPLTVIATLLDVFGTDHHSAPRIPKSGSVSPGFTCMKRIDDRTPCQAPTPINLASQDATASCAEFDIANSYGVSRSR